MYLWERGATVDAYVNSEVWAAVCADPNLTSITSKDFGILNGPTRVCHGLGAAIVA